MLTRLFILSFFIISNLLINNTVFAEKIQIDTAKSHLTWLGKKLGEDHGGVISLKSGFIEIDDEELTGGEFVIDMNSIENTDIESPTYKKKLEDHLKADDFFNVAKFPEGKFVVKRVKNAKIPTNEALIIGELTIKGITHTVQLPVMLKNLGGTYTGKGKTQIDRTKWEVKYNSKSFFSAAELGDKLIYDDIDIGVNLVTAAQ